MFAESYKSERGSGVVHVGRTFGSAGSARNVVDDSAKSLGLDHSVEADVPTCHSDTWFSQFPVCCTA